MRSFFQSLNGLLRGGAPRMRYGLTTNEFTTVAKVVRMFDRDGLHWTFSCSKKSKTGYNDREGDEGITNG